MSEDNTTLFNEDAEQALLGGIMINPDSYFEVCHDLKGEDFKIHRNRFVWEAMVSCAGKGLPIDQINIFDELARVNAEDVSVSYLSKLIVQCPNSYNVSSYAKTIAEFSARRKMIAAFESAAKLVYDKSADIDEVLSKVPTIINSVIESQNLKDDDGTQDADEASLDLLNDIDNNVPTGILTHFPEFDDIEFGLGGMPRGAASLWLGDSSMGKSTIMIQLAEQVAEHGGKKVIYFGYEQPNKSNVSRRVFSSTGINYKKMRSGSLTPDEQGKIRDEIVDNYQGRFSKNGGKFLMNSRARKLAQIKKIIRREKPDLVIVDQFKFIADRSKTDNITISFIENMHALKEIAKEFDCHIACVQPITKEESQKFLEANKKAMEQMAKNGGTGVANQVNKLPDINNVSWASELKFIVDVICFIVPDVNGVFVGVGAARPKIWQMVIWILKDRDGARNMDTYWEFDLEKQWWTGVRHPSKSVAQKPSSVNARNTVRYSPPPAKVMSASEQEYIFNDTPDEYLVEE